MKKPSTVLAYLSGALFSLGWWLWIDATVYANCDCPDNHTPDNVKVLGTHYIPGIVSTIALIMINIVSWNDLNGDFMFGDGVSTKAKVWLFVSFIIAFGALIAGCWIGVTRWFISTNPKPDSVWPGVAIILQNILIFVSATLYRFAKPEEESW